MRVILRWTYAEGRRVTRDLRLARFKQVLLAAQQAPHYQLVLREIGLATPEAVSSIDCVERILGRLPPIDLEEFNGTLWEFENTSGEHSVLESFQAPFSRQRQTAKTGILHPGFAAGPGVKVLKGPWPEELRCFTATALAAPVRLMREIAWELEQGYTRIRPLQHFVVPFTGPHTGELSEADREQFWRVFQVPVFEQRLGFDGRVIAHECEAHQGLHITGDQALFEQHTDSELLLTSLTDLRFPTLRVGTRVSGTIQGDCCDCGNAEPRLVLSSLHAAPLATAQSAA